MGTAQLPSCWEEARLHECADDALKRPQHSNGKTQTQLDPLYTKIRRQCGHAASLPLSTVMQKFWKDLLAVAKALQAWGLWQLGQGLVLSQAGVAVVNDAEL